MRIAAVRAVPFRLALRTPLRTARGPLPAREGWLLELETRGGICGWGEASPLPSFGTEDITVCRAALMALARRFVGSDAAQIDLDSGVLETVAPQAPVARFAFDCALHDLRARSEGRALSARLAATRGAGSARAQVEVNALLFAEAPRELAERAQCAAAEGFDSFKIKIGGRPLADDLARVRAVRAVLGPARRIRLDANGAWSEDEARRALESLAPFDPEVIEQPLAADQLDAMARLRALGLVPIAADEAVSSAPGARAVIDRAAADWLVLKPVALGGLTAAWRVAKEAAAAGLGYWVTSFVDSAVGRAAALSLAAALPGPMPACGLATGALLVRDLAVLAAPKAGFMTLSGGAGLGLVPDASRLAACCRGESIELRA